MICRATIDQLACVAGAKRGGGGGREKGKREGSPPPLPNPPPLFPFLPIPYPLPLSTPATQAIDQPDLCTGLVRKLGSCGAVDHKFTV